MMDRATRRDDLIAEVDLALAALRRVILRGIEPAKAAPPTVSLPQPPKAAAAPPAPKPPEPREIPVSMQRVSAAGLEVDLEACTVRFPSRRGGGPATVTRRQAQLAAVLVKASPSFITRTDATARAWPDLAISSRDVTATGAVKQLALALAPIGIKVEAVPGYGMRLWAMEDGK
jgi:hypothetical protein